MSSAIVPRALGHRLRALPDPGTDAGVACAGKCTTLLSLRMRTCWFSEQVTLP